MLWPEALHFAATSFRVRAIYLEFLAWWSLPESFGYVSPVLFQINMCTKSYFIGYICIGKIEG